MLTKFLAKMGRRRTVWKTHHTARVILIISALIIGSLPPPAPATVTNSNPGVPATRASKPVGTGIAPDNLVVGKKPAPAYTPASAPIAGSQPTLPGPQPTAPMTTAQPSRVVAGWLASWDMSEGLRVLREFPDALTEISPFWYEVNSDGHVINSPGAENPEALELIRTRGKPVIPTISIKQGENLGPVLNNPERRAAHINEILAKVDRGKYDGIDIDYEKLEAGDRDAFSQFTRDLSQSLRAKGKKTVITILPKTDEPGIWSGPQSHDYAAIGAAADQVRIMAYDQHYAGGPPGPIAPIDWVEKVVAFATTAIPAQKIVLGMPAYGYDWPTGQKAKSLVHDQVAAQSQASQAGIKWDEKSASSFFTYSDETGEHTVWFENRRSLEAKFQVAAKHGLGGVAIWRLGREDKGVYEALAAQFLGK